MTQLYDHVDAMRRVKAIHFVGIGGAGMGGIAEVLHNLGYQISGSDRHQNSMTTRLQKLGVKVYIGHKKEQVQGVDAVVVSTAIQMDNIEVQAAKQWHIPVLPRAEMLAELMRFRFGIAVAGTHGKTTTTSLISAVLAAGGLDPTFVIGGKVNSCNSHSGLGKSQYFVAEADESDASFLHLQPMMAVVTNIDADHMETYAGDFQKLRSTFIEFLHHLPFYGLAVIGLDDPHAAAIISKVNCPVSSYAIDNRDADIYAYDIKIKEHTSYFKVATKELAEWLIVTLPMPGVHNVRNALAAITIAKELGVDKQAIKTGLENFAGIGRRFQCYPPLIWQTGSVQLIDDYGHHPSELAATFAAIRAGWEEHRLVVIFQPHRYTRTRDLFDDFVQVLATADVLLLMEVYSAGEQRLVGYDSRSLLHHLRLRGQNNALFVENKEAIPDVLKNVLQAGDVLLTVGAGSIAKVPIYLQEKLFNG